MLAYLFLFLQAVILTLSPAGRERSWDADLRFSHWPALLIWSAATWWIHKRIRRSLPDSDPFIFPAAVLLSGWGLLIIYRLTPAFGLRQALWMLAALGMVIIILRVPTPLDLLRRYKYVLLSSGLILTALTLVFGTNPGGYGPRLWLGCCGIFLQPSEPLKLLLVAYLAAYFADRLPVSLRFLPIIVPTLAVVGLALLILLIQRDLGTTSIFIFLYAIMLFLVTNQRRILVLTLGGLAAAGVVGYFFVDVIQLRITAWLDPWRDPSGGAFQIVQSILAVANGGFFGRGLGMGNPGLVPVAHSDFIFSSLIEEGGLLAAAALLIVWGIFLLRGLRIALHATDPFRRLLAAGLTAYLGAQSILIMGGNLRLLPLTGVTLPFISYGGSSLVTAWLTLLSLLLISNTEEQEAAPLANPSAYTWLGALLTLGLGVTLVVASWWGLWRAPDLLLRNDNARRAIADRYVMRGSLLDRNGQPLNTTQGEPGSYRRVYLYPDLSPILGYTHSVYGLGGVEAGLDDTLRGLRGNPLGSILWEDLLYGTPPPGLDVRLSLDLSLQRLADDLLGADQGAIVLLNASTGEILAMASHPTYDANQLDALGPALNTDPSAPLLNRATQGQYGLSVLWEIYLSISAGRETITADEMPAFYEQVGIFTAPQMPMPVARPQQTDASAAVRASPLQMAIAAAALSNNGMRPAAQIAMAVNTPQAGWVILPTQPATDTQLDRQALAEGLGRYTLANTPFWGQPSTEINTLNTQGGSWNFIGGTLPGWAGTPVAVAVVIENTNPQREGGVSNPALRAQEIGTRLLQAAITP